MSIKFDIKKFLSENRLTQTSKILNEENLDNKTGDVNIYEDFNKENQHPELKLERILNELEEIYPSLSDYPQFKEGLDLLTNVYNEYMDYSDEIPNSI